MEIKINRSMTRTSFHIQLRVDVGVTFKTAFSTVLYPECFRSKSIIYYATRHTR